MRQLLLFMMVPLVLFSCQPRFEPDITSVEIEELIGYMASDELKGRYPGSDEDGLLLDYITTQYKQAGLTLLERKGLQTFEIVTEIESGPSNSFTFSGQSLEPDTDFRPFSFSTSATAEAELVFAGYGLQVEQEDLQWDDYASVDVKDKWVMILRDAPRQQDGSSPYVNYSEDRGKALLASDHGVSGVILVSGAGFNPQDDLVELGGKEHALSIPVIHLTRSAADRILTSAGADSISVLDARISSRMSPASFVTNVQLNITVDLQPLKMESANTLAYLKGADPSLRSEYLVIGAHHDHLGMGGTTSSRSYDTIAVHYGADDNASGVAGVIEISEYMVSRSPSRSILFTTFGAEEMGLVGSKYLSENSPIDLSLVQVMINMDMVGRLNDDRQLQIGGIGTSPGFRALLDSLNQKYNFSLKFSNEGFGPSDHSSFYAKDVPVLFVSTGAHPEYHTPRDNMASINLEGAEEVIKYVADVAEVLANQNERIAFNEAGPKVRGSSRGRRGGVTLGLMPDVTYDGSDGMPVMFVTEGKPAAVGGIQKADVIIAIEGKSVGNVYDYMSRMNALKEGMDIVVTVRRGGDELDLVVRL